MRPHHRKRKSKGKFSKKGHSEFQSAAITGQIDVAQELLNNSGKFVDVNEQDAHGNTALHLSAKVGEDDFLKWLLCLHEVDLKLRNSFGESAFHVAAGANKFTTMKLLLERAPEHFSVNDTTDYGDTSLSCAAKNGAFEAFTWLASQGGFIRQFNIAGDSAYHVAARTGNVRIVKWCIDEYGIPAEFVNADNKTAEYLATKNSHWDLMNWFRERKQSIAQREHTMKKMRAKFILHMKKGDFEGMKKLLVEGFDINHGQERHEGLTAMHEATIIGSADAITFLVQNNADINIRNNKGWTPLHMAVNSNNLPLVQHLISLGANPTVLSYDGKTLLAIALENGVKKDNSVICDFLCSLDSAGGVAGGDVIGVAKSKSLSIAYPISQKPVFKLDAEIPDDLLSPSQQVMKFLRVLDLQRYFDVLTAHGYDSLKRLALLTEVDLTRLGIGLEGHRRVFLDAARGLNSAMLEAVGLIRTSSERTERTELTAESSALDCKAGDLLDAPCSPFVDAELIDKPIDSPAVPPLHMRLSSSMTRSASSTSTNLLSVSESPAPAEIFHNEISFSHVVGEGSYGVVWKAHWRGMVVAVKELKTARDADDPMELMREAKVMKRVCNHQHVVEFIGVVFRPRVSIVTSFMQHGSVSDLLISGPKCRRDIPFHKILQMAADAAAGVLHLHCEGVIHRDLAARNLLVDNSLRVRVADFGFSRLSESDLTHAYTEKAIGPIKHMAPEAMRYKRYSKATDVFSFGVVLYEMFTRQPPWKACHNLDVVVRVCDGNRMPIPDHIPDNLKKLIESCWEHLPKNRPTMNAVVKILTDAKAEFDDFYKGELPRGSASAGISISGLASNALLTKGTGKTPRNSYDKAPSLAGAAVHRPYDKVGGTSAAEVELRARTEGAIETHSAPIIPHGLVRDDRGTTQTDIAREAVPTTTHIYEDTVDRLAVPIASLPLSHREYDILEMPGTVTPTLAIL